MVTGRPRSPQDQESAENMNIKRTLGCVLAERRLAGGNPNWTEVLGSVAVFINLQHGRGKFDVSAYEARQYSGRSMIMNLPAQRRRHENAGLLKNEYK